MKAMRVPTSTSPSPTRWPPNQMTPTIVTSSTSITSGNSRTKSCPTRSPTRAISVLASPNRSVSASSRTKARITRMPVSCSRITRLMASSLSW